MNSIRRHLSFSSSRVCAVAALCLILSFAARAAEAVPLAPPNDAFAEFAAEIISVFQRGGAILWALAAILAIGTLLGIERLASLSRDKHVPLDFEKDLTHLADTKGMDAGISLCREKPSALSRVLRAALVRHGAPLVNLEAALYQAAALEKFALIRRTRILGWFAAIAPIVGLLGFVLNASKHLGSDAPAEFERGAAALLSGVSDGLPCLSLALIATLVLLGFYFSARARAFDLAHELEIKGIETVLTLDRKSRQSIRLIEDIEDKIKTESMIKVPDLSAEFDEKGNPHESAIKTAVTTHTGDPIKE